MSWSNQASKLHDCDLTLGPVCMLSEPYQTALVLLCDTMQTPPLNCLFANADIEMHAVSSYRRRRLAMCGSQRPARAFDSQDDDRYFRASHEQ